MERRAASHTEEEEMNHRRRLLNAAKKGDQKAIGKLLELYQVRIYSGDMVTKMNKTSATHKLQAQLAEGKPVKGGSGGTIRRLRLRSRLQRNSPMQSRLRNRPLPKPHRVLLSRRQRPSQNQKLSRSR